MGLLLKESGDFKLVPAGQYVGICVDVVDLGIVKTTWEGREKQVHKCRLVFELDALDDNGKPLRASRQFTVSLSEKASIRAFLEAWRGKPFTAVELKGFDTETLIGVAALIQIIHTERNGKTYDNINSIMLPPRGTPWPKPSGEYIRVKDRVTEAGAPHDDAPPHDDDDSGLPF
jgi:hypothetical protein